jgi:hypothetical protein
MDTLQSHLNKKISALSAEHPYEYAIFRSLCIAAAACMLLYLYLVSVSILNVIAQKEASNASAILESRLGVLESEYFALSRNITRQHAEDMGLKPLAASSFVYRLSSVSAARGHNAI